MSESISLDRLQEAIRTGQPLTQELPEAASTDEPRDPADWSDSPRVAATDLRTVLLGLDPSEEGRQHWSGLTISGLVVVGRLDLRKARLQVPLTARECLFEGVVDLDDAEGVSISLTGSRLQGESADGSDVLEKDGETRSQSLRADNLQLRGTLSMDRGFVAEHGVWLASARVEGQVDCAGCTWHPDHDGNALTAFRLRVGNGLLLTRAVATGRIDLSNTIIGYGVDLSAGRFQAVTNPQDGDPDVPFAVALDFSDAVIDGSLVAQELMHVRGQWSLYSANVGEVSLTGGLHAEVSTTAVAVDATGLQCSKDFYGDRIRVSGAVMLNDATVGSLTLPRGRVITDSAHWALSAERLRSGRVDLGTELTLDSLSLAGATIGVEAILACQLDSGTVQALRLRNATVATQLILAPTCSVTGWADCSGLSVGGDCAINAQWQCSEGVALLGNALSVGGQLTLAPGGVMSAVDLTRADIGHDLMIGSLAGDSGVAATMTGIHVGGSLSAYEGCRLGGLLDLNDARIDGSVQLNGVTCGPPATTPEGGADEDLPDRQSAPPQGEGLSLAYADIGGSLYLGFGFVARGTTRLFFTKVAGVVNLRGGSFRASEGQLAALQAEGLRAISLIAYPTDPVENQPAQPTTLGGKASFDDAVIHRLNFTDAALDGQGDDAFSARRMTVEGPLFMCPATVVGRVDLRQAAVGQLRINRAVLRGGISTLGLHYDVIEGPEDPVGERLEVGELRAILPCGEDFAAQPYSQLAQAHRAAGREDEARRVLIRLREQQGRQSSGRRDLRAWNATRDALLRATVGFGYYPFRALWSLVAITAVGTLLFMLAHPDHLEPTRDVVPDFNSFFYSLDTTLPIIDFTQQAAWTPHDWAQWWAWFSIAAGWVLSTALVAGLTRAIRS